MTPPARKGTTLEKHRRTDARAVIDSVFLDVEDDSSLRHIPTIQLKVLAVNIQIVYNMYIINILRITHGKNQAITRT
jgi:uncharacterized membrane protein (DUF2068 family)